MRELSRSTLDGWRRERRRQLAQQTQQSRRSVERRPAAADSELLGRVQALERSLLQLEARFAEQREMLLALSRRR